MTKALKFQISKPLKGNAFFSIKQKKVILLMLHYWNETLKNVNKDQRNCHMHLPFHH